MWSVFLCSLPAEPEQEIFMQGELSQKKSCFIQKHSSSLLSAPLFTHNSLDLLPKAAAYFSWQPGSAAEPLTFCGLAEPLQVCGARWICMQLWGAWTQRSETEGVGSPFLSLAWTDTTQLLKSSKATSGGEALKNLCASKKQACIGTVVRFKSTSIKGTEYCQRKADSNLTMHVKCYVIKWDWFMEEKPNKKKQ